MHPKHLSINDFIYHLPGEKIALHPLEKRDQSKLLIYTEEKIKEDIYKNIAQYLPGNSPCCAPRLRNKLFRSLNLMKIVS
jgi:S-adenosylmethionine:tRNA ribosyltransferase-isomerase